MGLWNFVVDMSQEGRINELQERVEKLEEQNQILYEWVQYFRKKEDEQNSNKLP